MEAGYIERLLNTRGPHSSPGYVSPAAFETAGLEEIALAAQQTCPTARVKVRAGERRER